MQTGGKMRKSQLEAENTKLKSDIHEANEIIESKGDVIRLLYSKVAKLENDKKTLANLCKSYKAELDEPVDIYVAHLDWITGEPKELGWYFVAHEEPYLMSFRTVTTTLFYNPASSRSRWMRGEKGNAERFEGEVIAYIEAPGYGG
jgi:hypothetical protein